MVMTEGGRVTATKGTSFTCAVCWPAFTVCTRRLISMLTITKEKKVSMNNIISSTHTGELH